MIKHKTKHFNAIELCSQPETVAMTRTNGVLGKFSGTAEYISDDATVKTGFTAYISIDYDPDHAKILSKRVYSNANNPMVFKSSLDKAWFNLGAIEFIEKNFEELSKPLIMYIQHSRS